jgi:hypothetical protein
MPSVRTSPWAVLAAVALVLAVPVISWWLVGDLSDEQAAHPSHVLPAVELSATAERNVGTAAAAVALVCAVVVVRAWWKRRLGKRWRPTVVMLVLAGAALGFGYRVLSADAGGADERAGKVLIIGLPAFVAFVGAAVVIGLWRRPHKKLNKEHAAVDQ